MASLLVSDTFRGAWLRWPSFPAGGWPMTSATVAATPAAIWRARCCTFATAPMTARSAGLACRGLLRSEEHTSELQSLMRISYAVFCLKKKNIKYDSTTQERTQIALNYTEVQLT